MKYSKLKSSRLCLWWNDKTTFEKVSFVIRIVLTVFLIATIVSGYFSSWGWIKPVVALGIVVLHSICAYEDWLNERRGSAVFYLCLAVAWLLIFVLLLFPAF